MTQIYIAFRHLRYVDAISKDSFYKVVSGWYAVQSYLPAEWKTAKLSNDEYRILFINRCIKSMPEYGSEDHIEMIRCLGDCGAILANMRASLDTSLQLAMKGAIDIWKSDDWNLK